MKLGDEFPNFEADTTIGRIKFYDWLGDSWGILFSHPKDYTPVCTTELGRVVELTDEFKKRGIKLIALSCDSVEEHNGWTEARNTTEIGAIDIKACINYTSDFPYPIIGDPKRELAIAFGMLDPEERDKTGIPLPARAVFVIGSDKRVKLSILYPATTGRNFAEILRVIDSMQLTANKKVATPVDWKVGDPCMVLPSLSPEEAQRLFPAMQVKSLPSGKGYMRYTPQP